MKTFANYKWNFCETALIPISHIGISFFREYWEICMILLDFFAYHLHFLYFVQSHGTDQLLNTIKFLKIYEP